MTGHNKEITWEMLLEAGEALKKASENPWGGPLCSTCGDLRFLFTSETETTRCPDCTVMGGDGVLRIKGPIALWPAGPEKP